MKNHSLHFSYLIVSISNSADENIYVRSGCFMFKTFINNNMITPLINPCHTKKVFARQLIPHCP